VRRPAGKWVGLLFRCFGIFFLGVGSWWIASVFGANTPPTTATIDREQQQAEFAAKHRDFESAFKLNAAALNVVPLDWWSYFHRGVAESVLGGQRKEVKRDFALARYLLPNFPDIYLREGEIWLDIGEVDHAFDVWSEGMERLENVPAFYSDLYGFVRGDATLMDRWRQLAEGDKRCVLMFLKSADRFEFEIELTSLLADDPNLLSFTSADLKTLFHVWYDRGDKLALARALQQHPDWQKIGWRELAQTYADYRDYRPAYETVRRFAEPPNLPKPRPNESVESLALRFRLGDEIEHDGLALAIAEIDRGQLEDALAIVKIVSTKSGLSPAAHYIQGEIFAKMGDWPKAWRAMSEFQRETE
jgi:hypothetical protein